VAGLLGCLFWAEAMNENASTIKLLKSIFFIT
jgi:hypothetical protein